MHSKRSGFTLLELIVVVTVFMIVLGAIMATLQTADQTSRANIARTQAVEQGKNALAKVAEEIEESGRHTIGTSFGYLTRTLAATPPAAPSGAPYASSFTLTSDYAYTYTRTYQYKSGKQCGSYYCPWSYNTTTAAFQYPEAQLTEWRYQYVNPTSSSVYTYHYGRPWPDSFTTCPLDGSTLMDGTYQGAIRFFSPRDKDGNFITDEYSASEAANDMQKKQDWQSIVFYMPFYNSERQTSELRRYVIYKTDLFATSSEHSYFYAVDSAWTSWADNRVRDAGGTLQANLPTMIDLLDWGTDGGSAALDTTLDGKVPQSPIDSDAHYEYYMGYTYLSGTTVEGYLYWMKYTYDQASGNYRYWYLYINRRTGQIYWNVYFGNANWTSYWYRYAMINRTPQTIVSNVRSIDFSTSTSNPYDASSNPGGVSSTDVLRITLLIDKETIRRGARDIKESVLTQQVSPRNY